MMMLVIAWLAKRLQPILIVALLGTAALLFWKHLQLQNERTDHANTKATHAQVIGDLEKAAREQSEKNRQIEQGYESTLKQKEKEHAQQMETLARVVAALRASNDRLRSDAGRAATGNRDATEDTVASCRLRAEGLAQLFGEAAAEAAGLAEEADRLAADVNLTCGAWPRSE
jgi:uncharacterized protein HemX